MKRLRHVDVTMTRTSNGVVSPTEACHFYRQAVENVFADDKLFIHCIQNCELRQQHVYLTCTCFEKSKRGISVICK